MKTNSHLPAAALLALVAFSASVVAQTPTTTQSNQSTTATSRDTTTTTRSTDRNAAPATTVDQNRSDRTATGVTSAGSSTRQSGLNDQGVNRDNKLSRADRNFFEEAAKSGMKEVEVSGAVKARLTNPQVRAFAEMMVADHSAANTELMQLAAKKGVTLPADKKDHGHKWTKKDTGDDDLDEDYVDTMEDDHEEAVELFEKASKSEDPDIAAFAQKTLPKLQHHLEQVRSLKKLVD